MGKLITVGVGFSQNNDSYLAASEASEKALKQLKGKQPSLSLVFWAGKPYEDYIPVNKALMEHLSGTEFVGGSTDGVVYDGQIYPTGLVVASFYSEYVHFGVSSVEDVSRDPKKLAKETIKKAVGSIKIDHYVDSYMAFTRVKKGNISDLIRMPAFFVFAFTRGFQPTRMGNEDLIIDGIQDELGYYVPIFGGSLGNDMDKVFSNTPYDIVSLHSGKIMKDGLITVFAISDIKYAASYAHGAEPLNKIGSISQVKNGGFVVSKINDTPIYQWYANQIGISVKEFRLKILYYTQKYPLGFPDGYGNIIMRAGGVPFGKDELSYIAPLKENTPIFLMNLENNKRLMQANNELLADIHKHLNKNKLFSRWLRADMSFVVSCSSRRRVLDQKSSHRELAELSKLSRSPLFGFCSFGEIGGKPAGQSHFHHLCTNVFNFYDKLMSE